MLLLARIHFPHIATIAHVLQVALLTGLTCTLLPPTVLYPCVNAYIRNELERRGYVMSHVDPKDLPLMEKLNFAYPQLVVLLVWQPTIVCVRPPAAEQKRMQRSALQQQDG